MWNVNSTQTQHYDLLTNTIADAFATSYRYDGNGNILELNRKDHFGTGMDVLAYTYQAGTNKLTHIDDQIPNNAIAGVNDLTDQDPNNYAYDAIGNLTQDAKEEKLYQWTPYGKLRNVAPSNTGAVNKGYLDFKYDGTGNRVYKKYSAPPVAANQSPLFPTVETFYLRDAQGNVLATYERTGDKNNGVVLVQKEIHLYGSDRLGIRLRELETPEDPTGTGGTGGNNGDPDPSGSASGQRKMVIEEVMYDSKLSTELGIEEKHFGEYLILKNVWNSAINLGTFSLKNTETNQYVYFDSVEVESGQRVIVAYGEGDFTDKAQFVLATHFPESRLEDESLIWHWQTDMVLGDDAATIQLFETNTQKDELRYGSDFGKLAENDSTQDSVYVLKREGYEKGQNTSDYPEYAKQAKDWEQQGDIALIKGDYVLRELHLKRYELKDHLGNVRVIVADVKDATLGLQGQPREFAAILKHYSNYYPFGMEKPAMVYDKGGYRYGFNGQEQVNEMAGAGNHNTALFWEFDMRTARRWNLDPKPNISISGYAAFSLNPILFCDVLGDTTKFYAMGADSNQPFKMIDDGSENNDIMVNKMLYDFYVLKLGRELGERKGLYAKLFPKQIFNAIDVIKMCQAMNQAEEDWGFNIIAYETGNYQLDFDGNTISSQEMTGKNLGSHNAEYGITGNMHLNSIFDDGSTLTKESYPFTSGPYGNGPIPNNNYSVSWGADGTSDGMDIWTANTPETGMRLNSGANGWKLRLPNFNGRSGILIHPDCNSIGTAGCIGIRSTNDQSLIRLGNFFQNYIQTERRVLNINFQIPNNPNYGNNGNANPNTGQ